MCFKLGACVLQICPKCLWRLEAALVCTYCNCKKSNPVNNFQSRYIKSLTVQKAFELSSDCERTLFVLRYCADTRLDKQCAICTLHLFDSAKCTFQFHSWPWQRGWLADVRTWGKGRTYRGIRTFINTNLHIVLFFSLHLTSQGPQTPRGKFHL